MDFFTFSWGKNYIAIRGMLRVLGHTLRTPEEIDEKIIKKGIANSPSSMCYSGKAVIGQLIDQLDKGARNFIYLSSQGIEACRCADTGDFFQLLSKKRYPGFKSYRLGGNGEKESRETMSAVFPEIPRRQHNKAFKIYFWKLGVLDTIAGEALKSRALVVDSKKVSQLEEEYIEKTDKCNSIAGLWLTGFYFCCKLFFLKKKKNKPLLKIGLIGGEHILSELDSVMARMKGLADKGVYLEWRSGFFAMNRLAAGHSLEEKKSKKTSNEDTKELSLMKNKCRDYLRVEDTGSEILSCYRALEFAEENFDGLLHIYAFGCMPQTAGKPSLQKISSDYKIPLLSLSLGDRFDAVSLETRIEAFLDILERSKRL